MSVWMDLDPEVAAGRGPLLIIDRDGVVNRDRHYLSDPADVELLPGSAAAMAKAAAAGWTVLGVSNQSGIGRGLFGFEAFGEVMTRLDGLLAAKGAAFAGFYFCPHQPGDSCACRKPLPGMLAEAGVLEGIAGRMAVVIGDKAGDVALGRDLGLPAVLVRTGYGAGFEAEVRKRWPEDPLVQVADDLAAAVDLVLSGEGQR